ncbi:MAG: glycosyltransferase family 4 protein [Firmicutes bacterium]|nr:glycosyltransferase family 4 protein [Bacillota bacterium]
MRVLMISKACVTATYRTKVARLNRYPDLDMGLLVPTKWGALPFESDPSDGEYALFRADVPLSGRNHFHWYPGLAGYVRQFRPDLIHIDEEPYSVVTWQALRVAEAFRIPSLFFTWQNIEKRYPLPFSAMEHYAYRRTVGAIAGNQEAEEVLRHKGYRQPIWIIPQFGTDVSMFFPRERTPIRARYGVSGSFVVGYVGRLVEDKGIGDLLAAVTPLLKADREMGLVVVGRGPMSEAVKSWSTQEQLQRQVTVVPWVASDAMGEVMNLMDVLVLPSRTTPRWKEQFGRVLTEAMASGDVVVGSDSGEIPHVIGDAGLVFPEGDAAALREAIARLRHNPDEYARLRQRGLDRVRAYFTQDVIAERTREVYLALGGLSG